MAEGRDCLGRFVAGNQFARGRIAWNRMPEHYRSCTRLSIKGKSVYLNRVTYERFYGSIPPGMIIHHKDGDVNNNAIENLELMSNSAHASYHNNLNKLRCYINQGYDRICNKTKKGRK